MRVKSVLAAVVYQFVAFSLMFQKPLKLISLALNMHKIVLKHNMLNLMSVSLSNSIFFMLEMTAIGQQGVLETLVKLHCCSATEAPTMNCTRLHEADSLK